MKTLTDNALIFLPTPYIRSLSSTDTYLYVLGHTFLTAKMFLHGYIVQCHAKTCCVDNLSSVDIIERCKPYLYDSIILNIQYYI